MYNVNPNDDRCEPSCLLHRIAKIACMSIVITADACELDMPLMLKTTLNVDKNV